MKKISCLLLSAFLFACAGNPPEWWNPSGRYTTGSSIQGQTAQSASQTTPSSVTQTNVSPAEETFTPEETTFEEMELKPEANQSLEDAVEELQPSILDD